MPIFKQATGFDDQRKLYRAIAQDLVQGGMALVSVNGDNTQTDPANIPEDVATLVLAATPTMDPVADDQPWRLCFKLTKDTVRAYAATPLQILDDGTVSVSGKSTITAGGTPGTPSTSAAFPSYSGTIGNYRPDVAGTGTTPADIAQRDTYFYHRGLIDKGDVLAKGSMQFAVDPNPANLFLADQSATPFSYAVSVSAHGIAIVTNVEAQDDLGCRQNWFCIQRAINPDGTVVVTGKAPLFCLYSCYGGGAADANTVVPLGIMRFTVRESDLNAPAPATSAVAHTPDSNAVMNPIQQVTFNENNRYDFRFPAGLNTHRHSYPYEIDMIGYGSADVSSQRIGIEVQVYGETKDGQPLLRKYRAQAANSPRNTGMRLFLLELGGGIDAQP